MLNLLRLAEAQFNLTYVFISHDLNVVRYITDRVLVMYLGRVVELGPVDAIFAAGAPSLYARAAGVAAVDGSGAADRGAADRGRPTQSDRSALRLPLPHPLLRSPRRCAGANRRNWAWATAHRTSRRAI